MAQNDKSAIYFVVPGDPIPKARPRLRRGGGAMTPPRTVAYEAQVAWHARSVVSQPLEGDLILVLRFYCGDQRLRDLDNLCKSVMDGLRGIAYLDDHQVCRLIAERALDRENPRTEIGIIAIE